MNGTSPGPSDQGVAIGHEPSDVDPRGLLLLFVAGLFATLLLAGGFVWWLLATFAKEATLAEPPLSPFVQDRVAPPGPQLQAAPTAELRRFREREEELLNSAAWIDRQRNLARIPIERAIEIVAKEGLPRWPAATTEQSNEGAEDQP